MHKDQKRVRDDFLPYVTDRVLVSSPEAERDCTLLNRAFMQGPDPLYLLSVCPTTLDAQGVKVDVQVSPSYGYNLARVLPTTNPA